MHRSLKQAELAASQDIHQLRASYISTRSAHRQLLRRFKAIEAQTKDSFSSTILSRNPDPLFKHIKSRRREKSSNINRLNVHDKTYLDEDVPDGFFDSISTLKTKDHDLLQNSPCFQNLSADFHHILEVSRH